MGIDASIAMSVQDNLSAAVVTMKNSMTAFRNDVEELRKELDFLNNSKTNIRVDMNAAMIEVKNAKKAFQELGDSATEAERKAAEADWRQAEQNLENIRQQYDLVSRQVRQTTRDFEAASGMASRAENRAGTGSTGVLAAQGKAGVLNMAGDAAGQWANTLVGSAMGSEVGGLFGGALGGAVQGAAMGSLAGPVGTAVGAAVGGGIGLLTGGAQAFEARDDAFKDYYGGVFDEQYQAVQQNQQAGSETAAQRQLDTIAFNRLLGDGVGTQYLQDLQQMAADTPMQYQELTTMSRALATGFGDNTDRMLSLMTGIGNAGSAVGTDAAGMAAMSQALSRMQSSDKASLEYLNMFQERGIDVIGMLGEALGKNQGQVYDMISKGDIPGTQAVSIIEEGLGRFAGAMDEMSKTFEGRSSTLSDTMAEIYNAGGDRYNESRSEGMAQEIEAYGGALGDAMKEAYEAIGAGKAALENLGEAYTRDALSAVLEGSELTQEWDASTAEQLASLSEEYQAAMADYKAGNEEAGVKIDDIIASAEGLAQQQFEASDLYRADLDAQAESLAALRENTAAVRAAAGAYGLAQERTKGMGTGVSGNPNVEYKSWMDPNSSDYDPARAFTGNAWGLDRVPYDNYPTLLHQDERVLTAREAREQDMERSRAKSPETIMATALARTAPVSVARSNPDTRESSGALEALRGGLPAVPARADDRRGAAGELAGMMLEGSRPSERGRTQETTSQRESAGRTWNITITGNNFGAGVSAEEIAQRLADQIELHMAAGALS